MIDLVNNATHYRNRSEKGWGYHYNNAQLMYSKLAVRSFIKNILLMFYLHSFMGVVRRNGRAFEVISRVQWTLFISLVCRWRKNYYSFNIVIIDSIFSSEWFSNLLFYIINLPIMLHELKRKLLNHPEEFWSELSEYVIFVYRR